MRSVISKDRACSLLYRQLTFLLIRPTCLEDKDVNVSDMLGRSIFSPTSENATRCTHNEKKSRDFTSLCRHSLRSCQTLPITVKEETNGGTKSVMAVNEADKKRISLNSSKLHCERKPIRGRQAVITTSGC